jgi:fatty-acyl-CoA synthase
MVGSRSHSGSLASMRTVVDAIADQANGTGTLAVLGGDGGVAVSLPWSAVHERARRMSTVLAGVGIGPGSRVGLLGDTTIDLVAALQAVWLCGAAVTVLPPPTRSGDNLAAIAADADLHLVVADTAPPGMEVMDLADLAAGATAAPAAVPVRPDPADLAVLQYTSGSTRDPRGVPVTHRHLAANLEAIKLATDHERSHPSRMLSWLPLYHDMGLVGFLALPMACGCPLLLQSPSAFARYPAGWLEAISRHGITSTGGPNFVYALLTRLLAGGLDVDLRSVRFMLTGGEPVDAAAMSSFVAAAGRYGLDPGAVVPAYGMAESTLAVSFSPRGAGLRLDRIDPGALESAGKAVPVGPDDPARQLVLLGHPVPGTSLRIIDERTRAPVRARQVGHIEIRGASVVGHYRGDPVPPDGSWFHTGDLGYLTDDGELVVCGRAKDVLFAAGRNIFPQDIEAAATEVPGVRAGGAAAFGVPGELGDQLVLAVETRAAPAEDIRRAVAAAVVAETGLAPAAIVVVPVNGLPRTSSGKLRRAETRRRYLLGQLGSDTPARRV